MPGPTIVDVKSTSGHAASLQAAAFATDPANADAVVVCLSVYQLSGATINAPTDTAGNTYTQIGTTITGANGSISMWLAKNITGGASFRVTGNLSAVRYFAMVAWALTGVGADPYNGDWANRTGATDSADAGPYGSAPPADSIFIGCISVENSNVPTNGSGWNTTGANGFTAGMNTAARVADYSANFDIFCEYKISSIAESAHWMTNATWQWEAMQASFGVASAPSVAIWYPVVEDRRQPPPSPIPSWPFVAATWGVGTGTLATLEFLSFYPNRLPEHPAPHVTWPSAFAVPYSKQAYPAPDILATQRFLPTYPPAARRQPRNFDRSFSTSSAALDQTIHPTRWQPTFPSQPPPLHRSRSAPSVFEPPPSVGVVIAQSLAWRPTFPDYTTRAHRLTAGESFYAIPPSVPASVPGLCVELGLDAVASTDLRSEAATVSDLLDESAVSSSLLSEDVC